MILWCGKCNTLVDKQLSADDYLMNTKLYRAYCHGEELEFSVPCNELLPICKVFNKVEEKK